MNKIFTILLPIIQIVTAILAAVVFFQSLARSGAMLTLILALLTAILGFTLGIRGILTWKAAKK